MEFNNGDWVGDLFTPTNTEIHRSIKGINPEIDETLIKKIKLKNSKLTDILTVLQEFKIKQIEGLSNSILYLVFKDLTNKKDLSYNELNTISNYIEKKVSGPQKRKFFGAIKHILEIKNMEQFLTFYGIQRFLDYVDEKICSFLDELKNSYTNLNLNLNNGMKLTEYIEDLKNMEKNKRIKTFFETLNEKYFEGYSVKDLLTKELSICSKTNILFKKQIIISILKILNNEKEDPKLNYLLKTLENSGKTIILVSDKKQIEYISHYLNNSDIFCTSITNNTKPPLFGEDILITTPGLYSKVLHKRHAKTLILYDGEKYSEIDEGLKIRFKTIINLQFDIF
ncbi:hypothetical protein KO317_02050 [Candidatus Micrarchaeota archaeon]|nr:hypothetical protein [Candidatus Micrarchaeota archaeon]